MNENLTPEQNQKITEALLAGQKIQAIKLYREATGKGLKEAKQEIEGFASDLVAQDPVKYQKLAAKGSGGCVSVLILCGSLGWAAFEVMKILG